MVFNRHLAGLWGKRMAVGCHFQHKSLTLAWQRCVGSHQPCTQETKEARRLLPGAGGGEREEGKVKWEIWQPQDCQGGGQLGLLWAPSSSGSSSPGDVPHPSLSPCSLAKFPAWETFPPTVPHGKHQQIFSVRKLELLPQPPFAEALQGLTRSHPWDRGQQPLLVSQKYRCPRAAARSPAAAEAAWCLGLHKIWSCSQLGGGQDARAASSL